MENKTIYTTEKISAAVWLRDQIEALGGDSGTVVRGGDEPEVLLDVLGTYDETVYINLESVAITGDDDETYEVLDAWKFELDDSTKIWELIDSYVAAGGELSDFSGPSYY
jgi:hypothetical protein